MLPGFAARKRSGLIPVVFSARASPAPGADDVAVRLLETLGRSGSARGQARGDGEPHLRFRRRESLLITTDVPTVSQITTASRVLPCYSLVLELDLAIIGDLVYQTGPAPFEANQPVRFDPTQAEIADAALRLLRLFERPGALAVLGEQLSRELHYWLLSGRHAGAIRALGAINSHSQWIERAAALLRNHYASRYGSRHWQRSQA